MMSFLPCLIAFGGFYPYMCLFSFENLSQNYSPHENYGSIALFQDSLKMGTWLELSMGPGLEMWCMFMLDRVLLSPPRIVSVCGLM